MRRNMPRTPDTRQGGTTGSMQETPGGVRRYILDNDEHTFSSDWTDGDIAWFLKEATDAMETAERRERIAMSLGEHGL